MRRASHPALIALVALSGCVTGVDPQAIAWDSREQIYRAEASQVQVRNAQSRVYDTTDEQRMLEAIVATYQDLDFQIEVLDLELGIISGKRFLDRASMTEADRATYLLYDEESLIIFNLSLIHI